MPRPTLPVLLATLLTAGPLAAQGSPSAVAPASPGAAGPAPAAALASATLPVAGDSAERLLERLRSDLRQLAVAQERHYMDHGTYTTDLAALGLLPAREARRQAPTLAVIFAGGRGWTAVAMHRALGGRSCVMFVGPLDELPRLPATAVEGRTPTQEGAPLCDSAR